MKYFYIFKVNLFGEDTLFLDMLSQFLEEQGYFLCNNINEKAEADIDIRVYKETTDYKPEETSDNMQILIFKNLNRSMLKNTLNRNDIIICDYKAPLNIFVDLGLEYCINNKIDIGNRKKTEIARKSFT